jgi:nucleoside-diphosphate-sugar epimerase
VRICVTGIGGFLGSSLARQLHADGHEICGTAREKSLAADLLPADVELASWALGEAFPRDLLTRCEVLIHCAYAPAKAQAELNVCGTLHARDAGRDSRVARQLFLSSYSARPDAVSSYGRMKHALEAEFSQPGEQVIRPGLVVGPGGLFARMVQSVRRMPVLPLPDGGHRPAPIIGYRDLLRCIRVLLSEEPVRPLNLAYAQQPSLRDLLRSIAGSLGKRRALVPFPSGLALAILAMLRRIGLGFGVDAESLKGYRVNQPDLFESDINRFGLATPPLEQVVEEAVQDCGRPLRLRAPLAGEENLPS